LSKDIYDYDDIVEMKLDNKKFIVNKVLGQKFFIVENEYPFVVNPYEVKGYDTFLERNSRKSLTTLNSHLLLNSGEIVNNNIYFCLAEDVLKFNEVNTIPEALTMKIYFPFLYEKNINNLDDLKVKMNELFENTKQKYTNVIRELKYVERFQYYGYQVSRGIYYHIQINMLTVHHETDMYSEMNIGICTICNEYIKNTKCLCNLKLK
jgi:hypothetical protein